MNTMTEWLGDKVEARSNVTGNNHTIVCEVFCRTWQEEHPFGSTFVYESLAEPVEPFQSRWTVDGNVQTREEVVDEFGLDVVQKLEGGM